MIPVFPITRIIRLEKEIESLKRDIKRLKDEKLPFWRKHKNLWKL